MENIAIRKQYSPLYLLTLRLICHALPEPDASLTDVARPELNRLCLLPERVSCLFLFPERVSVSSEPWVLRSRQHLPVMVRGNVSFNVCAFMFGWRYYLCGACSEFPPLSYQLCYCYAILCTRDLQDSLYYFYYCSHLNPK